jgi:hypothetical protein
MNISRSGYYKWLKTKDILNRHEINRRDLEPLIRDIHNKKKSYGYRRINAIISLTGSAQTHFVNEFSSAGINQTRHQIFLKTTVTLLVVFPTTTVTTAYTMTMLVAETIIVGKVPLAYGEMTQK